MKHRSKVQDLLSQESCGRIAIILGLYKDLNENKKLALMVFLLYIFISGMVMRV